MNNEEDKKINFLALIISGIIIAIVVFFMEMLIDYIGINLKLPNLIIFLMRPVMYAITIISAQILVEKVKQKIKKSK